jgi:hypothetical protein
MAGVIKTKGLRRDTKRKEESAERSVPGRKEESFLRGKSENPLHFMDLAEDSLPLVQESAAFPCPEPDEQAQHPPILFHYGTL